MKAVVRTDVELPKGFNTDVQHSENIVGVVVLTLSEYSLSAKVQGKVPSMKDIQAVLTQKGDGDEYSRAWAASKTE